VTEEQTPQAGAEAEAQQGQPPLVINAQYVKDFSFENPNSPKILLEQKEPPAVQINVDVKTAKLSDTVYEVSLNIQAQAKSNAETAFLCELVYAGVFTIKGIPEEQLQPVLLIECPRLLFPFARAVIADATREGGFAPLLIHPIDFAGLYLKQRQSEATEAAPQQAS